MMEIGSVVQLMLPSFVLCTLMVGMLSYLGIHVIKRQIIFVDLALAQIAALGTLVGLVLGIPLHTPGSYLYAVALTSIAAAVFSIFRTRESRVPQEALIGLAYAIAAGTTIILIDKAPHGAEHIKDILTGSILWVRWSTVRTVAIVYAVVGLFHYLFRRQFLLISEDVSKAEAAGMHVRIWDFLFYVSFGIVITATVGPAGVLLVFVFLVAPAVMALLVTPNLGRQLLIGWGLGIVATIAGLVVSYVGDLSTGPVVIGTYAVVLVLVTVVLYIVRSPQRLAAVRTTVLTVAAFAIAFLLLVLVGRRIEGGHEHGEHSHQMPGSAHPVEPGEIGVGQIDLMDGEGPESVIATVDRALKRDLRAGALLAVQFLEQNPPLFYAQSVVATLDSLMAVTSGFDVMQASDTPSNREALENIRGFFGIREGE